MTTPDLPICPNDGKPIHDGKFLCRGCIKTFQVALGHIIELRPELELSITRQSHTRTGPRRPEDTTQSALADVEPLPFSNTLEPPIPNEDPLAVNLAASQAATEADRTIRHWVRQLVTTRGVQLPKMAAVPTTKIVPVPSTGRAPRWTRLEPWRPATNTNPACPVIPAHPTARGAWLLWTNLDWIVKRPSAPAVLSAMLAVEATLTNAVDTTARDSMVIGVCPVEWPDPTQDDLMTPCGGDVRAWPIPSGTLVELSTLARPARLPKCMRCQTEATIDWWHHEMRPELSPRVTTNELISVIAFELRYTVSHDLLRQWKNRGKIHALPDRDKKGRTLWDHREVLDAIREDVRKQRMKGAGVS